MAVERGSARLIRHSRRDGPTVLLEGKSIADSAPCPSCQVRSTRVHARYRRRPLDLPWRGRVVRLVLAVHRFRCGNARCARRTFAEPFGAPCAPAPAADDSCRASGVNGTYECGACNDPKSTNCYYRPDGTLFPPGDYHPTWTQLTPTGTPPAGRASASAIYDPVNQRMLIYGGGFPSLRNDIWTLSLSGTPAWTQLTPAGSPPGVYYYHSAIYDSLNRRMVIFGGGDTGTYPGKYGTGQSTFSNGVWTLGPLGERPCSPTPTMLPATPTTFPISSSLNRALYLPLLASSWCKS